MLSAIVLAAGNSGRMGRPKALLEYRGELFIERVCASLRSAGVPERIAVLGRDAPAILSVWRPSGEKVVVNPDPDLGQLSSLRTGLSAASPEAEGFMVCLADQPEILPDTYKEVISFWSSHKESIVIPRCIRPPTLPAFPSENRHSVQKHTTGKRSPPPTLDTRLLVSFGYKRGHPIILPASCRKLCIEGPLEEGLHWVTHHPSVKVLDLDVPDTGIIRDCDTPGDYERLSAPGGT